jgi:hypothetical protein
VIKTEAATMTTRIGRAWVRWREAAWMFGVLVGLVSSGAAAQPAYERLPAFGASAILSPELLSGPNHRVADAVRNDGYLNHYVVISAFGEFSAPSTALLRIRVAELGLRRLPREALVRRPAGASTHERTNRAGVGVAQARLAAG